MYKRTKFSWMKHIDFILSDLICMHAAMIVAYMVWHFVLTGHFIFVYEYSMYRMLGIVLTLLHFCIVFFTNNYSGILRRGYLKELKSVTIHNAFLMASVFTYFVVLRVSDYYSRMTLGIFVILNVILMYIFRIAIKTYIRKKDVGINSRRHILIVTTKMEVASVVEKLGKLSNGMVIVGIALITDEKIDGDEVEGIPIVAYDSEAAYEYACRNVVDEVFIYIPNSNNDATGVIANNFLQMGITVHINLDMLSSNMPNVAVERLSDYTVMTTSINVGTPFGAFIKRTMDILAGILGCIITGILFIFLAPAIKIADPGPVFFGQKRVGKNGRIFTIYKFRSMYQDAEERKAELMKNNKMDGGMFKMDEDPRIIGSGPDGKRKGVGYWIRTLSLDEFPNFLSILKGDMSLVGTRPPTVGEYETYSLHHKSRLAAKPGLTGMWQVSGRSNITNFEEIVALDAEYIKNWTLSLDIKIIAKTFVVVFKRNGSM